MENNLDVIRKSVGAETKVMGVIKADAYGHGYFEVARCLSESGIDYLGVAETTEALFLRGKGISTPIMVLSYYCGDDIESLIDNDITITVFDMESAVKISSLAKDNNKTAKVHIKIDTGMSRLGFMFDDSGDVREGTIADIAQIRSLPNLYIEGIYSHFACSDDADDSFTRLQYSRFTALINALGKMNITFDIKHICNSGAILKYKDMHLDMVRAGLCLYGHLPSGDIENPGLLPVMGINSVIADVKNIKAGDTVSYARKFTAGSDMKIAVVPIGYADGFKRILSGKISMLVNGNVCPQIGLICMDQCMIDVSHVKNIKINDKVVIIGEDYGNNITVEEIAKCADTINYEIICAIGRRVPRVYIHRNSLFKVVSYLSD